MLFAQRVFHTAGIYGLAVLLPQFFIELLPPEFVKQQLGEEVVPGAVHPEHFYGFIGVAAAWQVAFLIIARDPVRYRLIMIPGILEKLSFGVAGLALFAAGRLTATGRSGSSGTRSVSRAEAGHYSAVRLKPDTTRQSG